jgi:hypothetical protein
MPTAVAAALMIATLAVVIMSRPDVGELERQLKQAELRLRAAEDNLPPPMRPQGDNTGVCINLGRTIEVKAQFRDATNFASFELERRSEGAAWTVIETGLKEPRYIDIRVEPGVPYLYRFTGHAKEGPKVASDEIPGRVPELGGLDPQASLNLKLKAVTSDLAVATFEIERFVDGVKFTYLFAVRPHEPIGGVINGVDYRTNLYVERIELGDQIDVPLGSRINKRVNLREINSPPTAKSKDLWKDSSIRVPLP